MSVVIEEYKRIAKSLKKQGWKLGKPFTTDNGGQKVTLTNKLTQSVLLATHAGYDKSKWKFYGDAEDMLEWQKAFNSENDKISAILTHIENTENELLQDSDMEICMNALWLEYNK